MEVGETRAEYQVSTPSHGLSDMQARFVRAMVGANISKKEAAIAAGYSPESANQAACTLLRDVRVQRAIEEEIAANIHAEGAMIAWSTMREIMQDKGASTQVRFQAAKWVLQVAGHVEKEPIKQQGLPEKPLNEYSANELEAFLKVAQSATAAVNQELRTIDAPLDAQIIEK